MIDDERVGRIFARRSFGIKLGLDMTHALLAELGNPEANLKIVHVAGTNGKGSVSTLVASVLACSGLKTGLYTSPHLVRLNERFKINGVDIEDRELEPLLEEIEDAALRVEKSGVGVPTFFECMTALGVLWFVRSGVHIAVAEVGMGGRLDATNVLSPLVSVVTRIGLDHQEYLGDTIAKIAAEKAGIIKPGVPVVCSMMPDEAVAVIDAKARSAGAPLVKAWDRVTVGRISGNLHGQKISLESAYDDYGTVNMKLAASYQLENIATAVATVEVLQGVLGVDFGRKTLVKGLSAAEWMGRFQCIGEHPDVILDGAHNPDGAAALVKALTDAKCGKKVRFVVGQCADKDSDGFFKTIAGICGRVWTVPLQNSRSATPQRLVEHAARYGLEAAACHSLAEGIAAAKADALANDTPVVICGSLFLVGEVLEHSSRNAEAVDSE